jgi:magnesium transporter
LHPSAAARTLSRLDVRDIRQILEAIPASLAAKVLDYMQPMTVSGCVADMDTEKSHELLSRMNASNAVAVIRLLSKVKQDEIFSTMPRVTAANLRMRMRFSESVIGAYADTDVLTFSAEQRVSDALRVYRNSRAQRTGHITYVLDADNKLLGVIDLGELLSAKESSTVQRLLRPVPAVLNVRAALQSVNRHPAWLTYDNLPVTNRNGVFQGVLWRSSISQQDQHIINEVADYGETATTYSALADIFWLSVGALLTRKPDLSSRDRED